MNSGLEHRPETGASSDTDPPSTGPDPMASPVDTKAPGHDSMVTVRLSEPPSLSVNTDLPVAVMPSRRSIFGPQCTPNSAIISDERNDQAGSEEVNAEQDANVETPTTAVGEVENTDGSVDGKDGLQDEDAEESDTEEVDWERLQKTEDEQVKDPDDNVGIGDCLEIP
jgi:hypothetical protein